MQITLVEDNPGDVRWFQLALAEIGIHPTLTVFKTGIDALEYFRSGPPPNLIVTDWRLPILTFPEFVQGVRSLPMYKSTPIAVATGVAYLIGKEVLALGIVCCLQKPVDPGELRELFSAATARGTNA